MAITSFQRYEKKFMLNKEQYDALIPRLLEYMSPDEYCKDGKQYSIYNIYYDTIDNSLIRHSLAKPYYKEKLRLRSYTIPRSRDDKVFLELKKKIGGIVNKRRVVLTLGEAYDLLERGIVPKTKGYMSKQVMNEILYFLKYNKVYPKVYISYERRAFFGKDNREFRMTFDQQITTRRDEVYLEKGCYGAQLLGEDKYLMEIKILDAMPLWLTSILSELKIYTTSFSKYGTEYKRYCLEQGKNREIREASIC